MRVSSGRTRLQPDYAVGARRTRQQRSGEPARLRSTIHARRTSTVECSRENAPKRASDPRQSACPPLSRHIGRVTQVHSLVRLKLPVNNFWERSLAVGSSIRQGAPVSTDSTRRARVGHGFESTGALSAAGRVEPLTRQLLGSMFQRIWVLPVPTGDGRPLRRGSGQETEQGRRSCPRTSTDLRLFAAILRWGR